jgi:hypothetical protein
MVKRILTIAFAAWAAFGLWLLIGTVLAFARGMIRDDPNAVQNVLVALIVHLGIPCAGLFLLLREKKQDQKRLK